MVSGNLDVETLGEPSRDLLDKYLMPRSPSIRVSDKETDYDDVPSLELGETLDSPSLSTSRLQTCNHTNSTGVVSRHMEQLYHRRSRGVDADYLSDPIHGSRIAHMPDEPSAALLSRKSMGREIPYELLKFQTVLGQGAFGRVYKALLWDTPVAVKELKQCTEGNDTFAEMKKELELLTSLRHPNCVLLLGYTPPPNATIVCEYMALGSLWDILHDPKQRVDFKQVLKVAKLVARGILYLHQNDPPIHHRDIKTQNVLIHGTSGKWHAVKVCDFGLSTLHSEDTNGSVGWCGSVQWRAPETARVYLAESDIFSYGTLLWELITREMPFAGIPPVEVWERVRAGERPVIPGHCPTAVASLIRACWREDPRMRPGWESILEGIRTIRRGGAARALFDRRPRGHGALPETDGEEECEAPSIRMEVVGVGGKDFYVDNAEDKKRASIYEAMNIRNSLSLLMLLPTYVAQARYISAMFRPEHFSKGNTTYCGLLDRTLFQQMDPEVSLLLCNEGQRKMSHIVLFNKCNIHGSCNTPANDALRRFADSSHEVGDLVGALSTPLLCEDVEAIHIPHFGPSPRFAALAHVSLREDMKTVASGLYVRKLVPWAMKGNLWRGGLTLTNYFSGQTVLVNFFSTAADRDKFFADGGYNFVMETLGVFLNNVPVVEYYNIAHLQVRQKTPEVVISSTPNSNTPKTD